MCVFFLVIVFFPICLLYWNSIVLSTQYFVIVLKVLIFDEPVLRLSLTCYYRINRESIVDVEGEVKAAAQKVQSCSQEDVEIFVDKVFTLSSKKKIYIYIYILKKNNAVVLISQEMWFCIGYMYVTNSAFQFRAIVRHMMLRMIASNLCFSLKNIHCEFASL